MKFKPVKLAVYLCGTGFGLMVIGAWHVGLLLVIWGGVYQLIAYSNFTETLKRVDELNMEAIHPSSPTPGHVEGCVCHRCRIYREENEDRVE